MRGKASDGVAGQVQAAVVVGQVGRHEVRPGVAVIGGITAADNAPGAVHEPVDVTGLRSCS